MRRTRRLRAERQPGRSRGGATSWSLMATLTAALCVALPGGCSGNSHDGPPPASPSKPSTGPSSPGSTSPGDAVTSTGLPLACAIDERAGVARPDGLLEAGVPFARGQVASTDRLQVRADGAVLPCRWEPLALWPDRSIRWARLVLPVALDAGETFRFSIDAGTPAPWSPALPGTPALALHLEDADGTTVFPIAAAGLQSRGDQQVFVDVEPLTKRRVRVRIQTAQVRGDGTWRSLSIRMDAPDGITLAPGSGAVSAAGWSLAVRDPVARGPVDVSTADGAAWLRLLPAGKRPLAADEGFHVTHEFILERKAEARDLARRIDSPLRLGFPAGYVDATRAMGRLGFAGESTRRFDAAFAQSWEAIREQQRSPRNRGPTAWGDFDVRGQGLAYLGYLNQEYDPATAFFIHAARTGDASALDLALAMARQFADNAVGLDGGVYQHRATLHALEHQLARALAERLTTRWRRGSASPPPPLEIALWVRDEYGSSTGNRVGAWLGELAAQPPADQERLVAERFAYALVEAARDAANQRGSAAARALGEGDARPRDYAAFLLESELLAAFDLPPVDALFAPFFARYGGGWDDFPAFHFHDLPDASLVHSPSHVLAEMLVWGHLATGDASLRRAALNVAEHHLSGGVVDRGIESVRGEMSDGEPVAARKVGWPLINLITLKLLTMGVDPGLDGRIDRAIESLLETLVAIPPRQYQGAIHVGVVGEALARLHEETGDERALEALVRLMRYWSREQWNDKRQAFNYTKDSADGGWPSLSGLVLHGLAYAATHGDEPELAARARQVLGTVERDGETDVKSFAMKFRNSPRALTPLAEAP